MKNQRGAITLYVTIACLFILMVGIAGYVQISNKQAEQMKQLKLMEESYNSGITWEDAYKSYEGGDVIKIRTVEELLKIGSGEQKYIDGKIYTFGNNNTYELEDDFEFDGNFKEVASRIKENDILINGNNHQIIANTESGRKEYYTKYTNYSIATNKYGYAIDGLELYYDGIDNTGTGEHSLSSTIWKDLSGNNRDGVINGKTTTDEEGWKENGLYFDGENDYVETGLNQQNLIENGEEFTFQVLLKARTTNTYSDIIGFHETDENEEKRGVIVQFEIGGLKFQYGNKENKWEGYLIDRNNILEITQNKVAFKDIELTVVYNINNHIKIYINGNLVKEEKVEGKINESDKFRVGGAGYESKSNSGKDRYFNGIIRNVRVYNRELSEEEIRINDNATNRRYTFENDVYNSKVIETGLPSEIFLDSSVDVPVVGSKLLNLDKNKIYQITFNGSCQGKPNTFNVDLYPDDLPEKHILYNEPANYTEIIFKSNSDNMSNCYLRFFDNIQEENEGDITITNVVLRELSQ